MLALAVLLVGAALVLPAALLARGAERDAAVRGLERPLAAAQTALTAEARRYADAVRQAAAALSTRSTAPDPVYFDSLSSSLAAARLPGAAGTAYVEPRGNADTVVLAHALDGRTVPTGWDASTVPELAAVLVRARASGRPAVSSPLVLPRDRSLAAERRQLAVVLAAPVVTDGQRFRGWVILSLRGDDLVRALLGDASGPVGAVMLTASDSSGHPVAVATVVSRGPGDAPRHGEIAPGAVRRSVQVPVVDRTWSLTVAASPAPAPSSGLVPLDVVVGAGGGVATVLLAALVLALAVARERALARWQAVTEELQAAERQSRRQADLLHDVLESISDGVSVIDGDGRYLVHNRAARAMLGTPGTGLPLQTWHEHYETLTADGATQLPAEELPLGRALAGQSCDDVDLLVHEAARGGARVLRVSAHPLRSGQLHGAVAVFSDVTDRTRAEAELERQAVVFSAITDAVFITDATGTVLDCNAAAEHMTGFTRADLLGRRPGEASPGQAALAGVADALRRDGEWRGDFPFARRGRPAGVAEAVVVALRDEQGRLTGTISAHRDVTEERRTAAALREAEQRFRLSFVNAPTGVQMADLHSVGFGRLLDVNPALCRMLGMSRSTLLQLTVADITHPDDRAQDAEWGRLLMSGEQERVRLEKRYVRADGEAVWVSVNVAVVRDEEGAPLYTVTQVEDVTARRRAREELRRANAELSGLNDALARTNAELDRFTAAVAHDLKNPLTSISGYSELLFDLCGGSLPPEGVQALDAVRRNADRMRTLIDDLLTYARAGSEPLRLSPVDLADLVADVVADLGPTLARTGGTVRAGQLGEVYAHRALLRQVLANLVGNAVKYVVPGVSPRVTVSAEPAEGGGWVISVADNGIGVPPDATERIFRMFHRETRRGYDGTGIGLATCQRIVERHGGRIWVRPADAGGSVFAFTLPAAPAQALTSTSTLPTVPLRTAS
nr:PAS domain S-box protein [Motilibacter aurantiacus]